MRTRVELDQNDIIKLIADRFDVDVKDVDLKIEKSYKYCGPMKTLTHEVKVTIGSEKFNWDRLRRKEV